MAMSDVATWGSQDSSVMTDTDVPSTSDELSQDADMIEWDDDIFDEYVVYAGQADSSADQDSPSEENLEETVPEDWQDWPVPAVEPTTKPVTTTTDETGEADVDEPVLPNRRKKKIRDEKE